MRVKIAYTDCPPWCRRHIEAALLVAEGLPHARQIVIDYLMSVLPFKHHGLVVEEQADSLAIVLRISGGRTLASIEIIDPSKISSQVPLQGS